MLEFDERWNHKNIRQMGDAYLDIETTGLSRFYDYITVIGIYRCHCKDNGLIQLIGKEITRGNLTSALKDINTIHTYNGTRFDLPFIAFSLGIDLSVKYHHRDLMYDCWHNNLYGGFKSVEQQLGIRRKLVGIGGLEAIQLWWSYYNNGNQSALVQLLEYNKEDVINLKTLKEKLTGHCA